MHTPGRAGGENRHLHGPTPRERGTRLWTGPSRRVRIKWRRLFLRLLRVGFSKTFSSTMALVKSSLATVRGIARTSVRISRNIIERAEWPPRLAWEKPNGLPCADMRFSYPKWPILRACPACGCQSRSAMRCWRPVRGTPSDHGVGCSSGYTPHRHTGTMVDCARWHFFRPLGTFDSQRNAQTVATSPSESEPFEARSDRSPRHPRTVGTRPGLNRLPRSHALRAP